MENLTAIIIDGNSLMHRAFYALPPMNTKKGEQVGAVYGFLSMLFKLIEQRPKYLLVAFDMPGPTFRHAVYEEYKAGRKETPDELKSQLNLIREVLKAMNICICECEGYEADDILGTFSRKAEADGNEALLVTGDRDAFQLVTEHTNVMLTKRGITDTERYDPAAIQARYGVKPENMVDIKGLMGDPSDNIPGVPGIGEKTAMKLIAEYGDLEHTLINAANIKGKLGESLVRYADQARMSREIAVIDTNIPVCIDLEACIFQYETISNARSKFIELEFRSLISRLPEQTSFIKTASAEKKAGLKEQYIESLEILKKTVDKLKPENKLAIDSEDVFSFAVSEQEQYSVKLQGNLLEMGFEPEQIVDVLKPLLETEAPQKLLFDTKRWMHALKGYGSGLGGTPFDVMIADYLLHAIHPTNTLRELVQERAGHMKSGAAALFSLEDQMFSELKAKGMDKLFYEVELPLTRVLFEMETEGFSVDIEMLKKLGENHNQRIAALENEIYEIAGEKFNILSTKQLGSILFEKLALPTVKKIKTGYSTDSEVLEKLEHRHPIVSKIIEYRTITKLKSTFIDGLLALVDHQTGKIHTRFNQNVTATGRISSTEPNLQNIPVRTDIGKEIRRAFIASEGNVLIGADYSQIELRVLAHISGDQTMIHAFNTGEDIHTRTAAEVIGCDLTEVTPSMRSAAKAVNFGIVYGISDFGLARNLGISRSQASDYIDRYLTRYVGVRQYMKDVVEKAKHDGYVSTLLGRRRELPEIYASNYNTRMFGERVAMNMPIQGTAADIIKLAMIRVSETLKKNGLKTKLILQIHDELILDAPKEEAETVVKLVHDCMENVMTLDVALEAEVNIGYSWYDTK